MADSITPTPAAQEGIGADVSGRRAAKKERTRHLLLSAAADVIAERGYHAASLAEIASRAGLTTGAVYSNFRGKEELFAAVIRDMAMALDLGPEAAAPWERLVRAAAEGMRSVDRPASRRLFKLQLEFALLTLQNPSLREEMVKDLRVDRQDLAALLAGGGEVPVPAFLPDPQQLATVVIATLQGLQQHRFLDREAVPAELAAWVMQAILHVARQERPAAT